MLASRVLRFDAFTLDLSRAILFRGDGQLGLRRQSFEVLRYLAEHTGEVVSAEELINAVWAAKPAQPEHSVVQCIKDIRGALGNDGRWIIRTVSGRGYQFVAQVAALEEPRPAPSGQDSGAPQIVAAPRSRWDLIAGTRRWWGAPIAAGLLIALLAAGGWLVWQRTRPEPAAVPTMMAVPTLAVLPLEALGDDPGGASTARALSDDFATVIARDYWGTMLSLMSTAGYRGQAIDPKLIGRQLGARYLLRGSLRREGERHVGNITLIEAETGRHIWAGPFSYNTAEERRRVGMHLAGRIGSTVATIESQRPLPEKPEARHYALLAQVTMANQRNAANTKAALALFQKALALDADCVPALLGYAWTQIAEFERGNPVDLDKARDAIEHAMKLELASAVAYHRRATLLRALGDSYGAIAANEHALTLNRNFTMPHAELGRNKLDIGLAAEAIAHIEEAIQLQPGHTIVFVWWHWAGEAALHMGDHATAVRWLEKSRQGNPAYTAPVPWLAVAYAGAGREEEGRLLLAEHAARTPGFTVSGWIAKHSPRNALAAAQFARVADTMRRLAAPGG